MDIDGLVLSSILFPIFLGIFKSEISSFFNDLALYSNRDTDDDGDPAAGQYCFIQKSLGSFIKIKVKKYEFGLRGCNRKVITLQPSPEFPEEFPEKFIIVPYSYLAWSQLIKGSKTQSL